MYRVTITNLVVEGKKYHRGDMVDVDSATAAKFGTQLEVAPKPKRGRPRNENKGSISRQ